MVDKEQGGQKREEDRPEVGRQEVSVWVSRQGGAATLDAGQ